MNRHRWYRLTAAALYAGVALVALPLVLAQEKTDKTGPTKKSFGKLDKWEPAPTTSHDHDAVSWLEQWGGTIQIISGAVLLAAIAVFVVLRLSKRTAPGNQPPLPPGNQDPMGRSGLTLVELLVVLVILVILTTVAIQSTSGIVDQGRYNATQQGLGNIQNAILGQRGTDGNPVLGSFVADMGRLPTPFYSAGTLVGDPLSELWNPTAVVGNGGATYAAVPVTIPSVNSLQTGLVVLSTAAKTPFTVTIPCGWRGPYLQLPVGATSLVDGWGNAFQSIYQAPGSTAYPPPVPVAAGNPINVVCSLGSDNAFDTVLPANPYAQDLYVPSQTIAPPTTPLVNFSQLAYGTVSVTVQAINTTLTPAALTNPYPSTPAETTPKVRVVFFAPVNGAMTTFSLDATAGVNATPLPAIPYYPNTLNTKPTDFAVTTTPSTAVSGFFYNVPIGPRALQAFQYDAASGLITKKSPLTYVNVPAANITTTLILQ